LAGRALHHAFWDEITSALDQIYSKARVTSNAAPFLLQNWIACTPFSVQDCPLCALELAGGLFLVNRDQRLTSACLWILFLFRVADNVARTNTFEFIQGKTRFA
jgi:hypothetical protein